MLGIDLTKISRFKNPSKELMQRFLHPKEIQAYSTTANKPRFLAKRWTIKEALFKANNKLYSFNKINLLDKNRQVILPGYHISTSCEDDYCVAVVIKE